MANNIAVIILNWNGKKDTIPCLESVKKIKYGRFVPIVVDNGSTDDSAEAIKSQFPDLVLIETNQNLGYAGGNNVGIEYALKRGFEWIFLLNNDTLVDEHILDEMLKLAPTYQIIGAKPYVYPFNGKLDHLGGKWNLKKGHFDLVGQNQTDEELQWDGQIDYVTGCSILIHRSVFETIGVLEPKFFLFWEESDFCHRATKAGFKIGVSLSAVLYHKGSASFVGGKPHSTYFWWRNRLLWIERNCTRKEKFSLFFVLFPEIFRLYRHFLLKLLSPKKNKEKIRRYRAAIAGVHDYFRRRYSNGPEWIYKKEG